MAGHELRKVALPAAYVVDLQEACKLIGIPASGTMFPDLDCMVTKHELADPHGVYPRSIVAAERQVHPPLAGISQLIMRPVNPQLQTACSA